MTAEPALLRLLPGEGRIEPTGLTLVRRLSDLEGLFADETARRHLADTADDVVYTVVSSPVPEEPGELPQSITTISPGDVAGEFFMTRGHQHPDPQGEIYLGLEGRGGVLMFDGRRAEFHELAEQHMVYIPPGWAHRSVNVGDVPLRFLAVYPGSAGHDYDWVVRHGMGRRVLRSGPGHALADFGVPS